MNSCVAIFIAWTASAPALIDLAAKTYHTDLVAALDPDADSYFAAGYYRFRNGDHAWGLRRYFFRGVDDKALLGDPFVRYRSSGQKRIPLPQ